MTRKYGNNPGMGNNSKKNKDFENAANAAGLTDMQKREMSKILHEEKEFETGDWSYSKLYELALEVKNK